MCGGWDLAALKNIMLGPCVLVPHTRPVHSVMTPPAVVLLFTVPAYLSLTPWSAGFALSFSPNFQFISSFLAHPFETQKMTLLAGFKKLQLTILRIYLVTTSIISPPSSWICAGPLVSGIC